MSFWSFWPFSRSKPEELTSEQLQVKLVDAAYAGQRSLRRFCRTYRQQIEANIDGLRKGPPGIVERPAEMNRYVQGLGAAAQCLANEFNSPGLWQALTGGDGDNPLVRWQEFIDAVPERMKRREYDQLRDELRELIVEVQRFGGDEARRFEAFFNGRLGEVLFNSGHPAEAAEPMQRALALCREINDRLGVAVYLSNLAELARYEGDVTAAIDWYSQYQEELRQQGRTSELPPIAKRIELLRRGEPLCRVVCRDGDHLVELDDLQPVQNKTYKFEFVRNRTDLLLCRQLTQEGNEKASSGELAAALELYQQAAEVDPYNPDPHYQSGAVLLELGTYAQAAEAFAETDRLAPGWFHCRADRWLAEQLASGELSPEVWTILRGLEDGDMPAGTRTQCAQRATEMYPDFAPFWLVLGDCCRDQPERAEAAYRRGLECAAEPDIRSRLLSALIGLQMDRPEASAWLEELNGLKGSLLAQAVARFAAVKRG